MIELLITYIFDGSLQIANITDYELEYILKEWGSLESYGKSIGAIITKL